MADVESRIESLCQTILKSDAENWDLRNKAVLQITDIVRGYEGQSSAVITDIFCASVFRTLKEPVKSLISDLRSQQVRDVCTLLVVLAKVTGERMKPFLRDSFVHILEGVKVPNKVMSGYVDDCIQNMIRYCTFKSCIPLLTMEIRDNKAKIVREKCIEYLNSILMFWDMTERDLDPVCDALKMALEDASPKARETARAVFQSLLGINSRKAEKLRGDLPRAIQAKLAVDDSGSALDISVSSIQLEKTMPEPPRTAERPRLHATQSMSTQKQHHNNNSAYPMSGIARSDFSKSFSGSTNSQSLLSGNIQAAVEPPPAPVAESVPVTPSLSQNGSSSSLNLRASASSMKSLVSSASAGSRRRSVVKNPFADISDSFAQGSNSLSNSQEFSSSFPTMSLSKSSPVSSKSSQRQSPVTSYQQSDAFGSFSGNSSPAVNHHQGEIIRRGAPFQDRSTPSSNQLSASGTFSASTTIESVASDNSQENIVAPSPMMTEIVLHSRVYAQVSKDNRLAATVRFIGQTQFSPGTWIGVELDSPVGKNNGSVQGVAYFWCRPNYGLFLREENVLPFPALSEGEKRILALTKSISASNVIAHPQTDVSSPSSTVMCSSNMTLDQISRKGDDSVENNFTVAKTSSHSQETKSKSAGMLKLKLSTVMNYLNAQLELVEELEKEEKLNPNTEKANQIRQEIISVTESELETIVSFRNKWKEFV